MDPYENIVDLYDLEHDAFDDDASFFVSLIQQSPVLEIGCGTGRIAERLARAGLEVTGIDTSEAMLAAARTRLAGLANASVHHMAVESLSLPQTFKSAIWPLNVLWHLTDLSAQIGAMKRVRACMVPKGLLVIDLSNPLTISNHQAGDSVQLRFHCGEGAAQVQGFSSTADQPSEQVLTLSLWYDRIAEDGTVRRTTSSLPLRYTYRYELELILIATGFRLEQTYGSYDLDPYGADSPGLLVVASAV
jgi:SAM-dependent methyltransferase